MSTSTFPAWQPIFLAHLVKTGQVACAAQRAKITRQNAYLARSTRVSGRIRTGQDRLLALAFAQTWREAQSEYSKEFEIAFRQRALEGTPRERHIYYKGKCVGVDQWRVYNDSLLIALAKSILPEKFASTSVKSDLPDFSSQDLAEREAIDNLASDLWCQVLDILDPAPNELKEDTPTVSPQINFSPAPVSSPTPTSPHQAQTATPVSTFSSTPTVSSPAEPIPALTPITNDELNISDLNVVVTDPIIFSPSQVSSLPHPTLYASFLSRALFASGRIITFPSAICEGLPTVCTLSASFSSTFHPIHAPPYNEDHPLPIQYGNPAVLTHPQ
jgi:hypothetical protein